MVHRIGKPRIDVTRSPPPNDANVPDTVRFQMSQPLVERDSLKAPNRSSSGLGVHGKMGIPEGALLPFGILLLGLPALRCFSLGVHFFLRKNGFLFLSFVPPKPVLRWVSYTNLRRESPGMVVAVSDGSFN